MPLKDLIELLRNKAPPSSLVRKAGGKLYINLCKATPRWTCIALDGLLTVIIREQTNQENGYFISLVFKDEREISLAPEDHKMGFTLAEANEIVFTV
jgi:hypothetical protein